MSELFLKIVNMGIAAGWLILVVLLIRLVFRKSPRRFNLLLWGLVGFRLIFPFTLESRVSLVPSAETISPAIMTAPDPGIRSGIPALNSVVNPAVEGAFAPAAGAGINPLQVWIPVFAGIWLAGMAALLVYTLLCWLKLKKQVRTATWLEDNIWESEELAEPFVFGLFRPQIYLPASLPEMSRRYVIAHEKTHIKRLDHWSKFLGFVLLSVYWFNPLIWVAYALFSKDIELACDAAVIADLSRDERADYSLTLLSLSAPRKILAACPVAFGEVAVKTRVKNILNYKKPAFWAVVVAVAAAIVAAVCFLTTRPSASPPSKELVKLASGYSRDAALKDGCVIVKDGMLQDNAERWQQLVAQTALGKKDSARFYFESAEPDTPYSLMDVAFDGEAWHTASVSSAEPSEKPAEDSYPYLVFSSTMDNGVAKGYFFLADSQADSQKEKVSAVEPRETINASDSETLPQDAVCERCVPLLYELLTEDMLSESAFDLTYCDIDSDGRLERCLLGLGPTSGVSSFDLSFYDGSNRKYHGSFITPFQTIRFTRDEKGQLQLEAGDWYPEPVTYIYDVEVTDGKVEVSEGGKALKRIELD